MCNKTALNVFSSKLKTFINNNVGTEVPKFYPNDMVANNLFQIIEIISVNSGEADLYKVKALRMQSECVLKLYRRKDAVKEDILNKLAVIHTPYIASLLDKGVIQGFPYIVIPFYSNNSLGSYVEQGIRFSLDDLKNLIIPSIAEGLKVLHDEGIIHKDLKPSNLMVSNDEQHIVLIDFGISSVTNGNTVVVTQTGKSPFYSAPETNTGLFLADSDYYSLGITLYELATGYTPYQNINIENLAGFQQIQKIPFPKEFDPELKDLIEGLTYKDISNRNDKANPNRRWGYEEIQKWLKGEKQQIPGQIGNSNQSTVSTTGAMNANKIPYIFKGQKFYDTTALITAFLKNWEEGKKEVFRGILTRHYQLLDNQSLEQQCIKAEQQFEQDNQKADLIFFNLMYFIEPTIKEFYWKGYSFKDTYNVGECLIKEVVERNSRDKTLLEIAMDKMAFIALKNYINIANDNKNVYLGIINSLEKLLASEPLDINRQALRFGYALTDQESFKIADKSFKNIEEFNKFLISLYASNLLAYRKFCEENEEAINKKKMLFSKVKKEKLTKNLLSTTKKIELGKYRKFIFRNIDEILKYVNLLWDNNKLNEFNDFKENCFSEIDALKAKANQQQKAQLDEYINRVNSCICFDEYIFKDVESLEQQINEYSGRIKERFMELHRDGVNRFLREPSKVIRNDLEKSLDFHVFELDIKEIGSYVKFGNYWQSNDKNKEAIEWKVLAKENGKALLISKYALDCKPYNQNNCNITWEECTLRKWINSDFINNAFSEEEQQIIALTKNDTNGSRTTEDKVFLLSIEEAQKYFKNAEERKCTPTPYAKQHNAWSSDDNFCYWWLRSPGCNQYFAARVNYDGGVSLYGYSVYNVNDAVRVALWVNLES